MGEVPEYTGILNIGMGAPIMSTTNHVPLT